MRLIYRAVCKSPNIWFKFSNVVVAKTMLLQVSVNMKSVEPETCITLGVG